MLIAEAKGDAKKLFSLVNTLCDKNRSNPLPECQSVGMLVSQFGKYFNNKMIADIIKTTVDVSEPPVIPYRDGNGVRLNKFVSLSEEDVRKLITKSKTTSCAYDPLPTRIIKEYINEMLPLLTHIINISLSTGVFPDQWKTALVVPLLKKTGLDLVPN